MDVLLGVIIGSNPLTVFGMIALAAGCLNFARLANGWMFRASLQHSVDRVNELALKNNDTEVADTALLEMNGDDYDGIQFSNDIVCHYKGFEFPSQIIIADGVYEFYGTVDIGEKDPIDMIKIRSSLGEAAVNDLFYFLKPGGLYKFIGVPEYTA